MKPPTEINPLAAWPASRALADSLGLPAVDGWEVLLSQGAISFLMWTGKSAPLDAMRDTLQP